MNCEVIRTQGFGGRGGPGLVCRLFKRRAPPSCAPRWGCKRTDTPCVAVPENAIRFERRRFNGHMQKIWADHSHLLLQSPREGGLLQGSIQGDAGCPFPGA